MRASWLGPEARRRALERLGTDTFDVLAIGGGVTGCGVALDAATRGLTVALVEKRDFAPGTSSRSSKLIHGDLRYLEHFDVKLVSAGHCTSGVYCSRRSPRTSSARRPSSSP